MKRSLLIIFCVIAGIIAVVANAPLAWVAKTAAPGDIDPSIHFGGTIWDGHVSGFPGIGPIRLKSSLPDAITGKPFIAFETQSPVFVADGHAKPGQVKDVTMRGNFGQLAKIDGRFSGLSGNFNVVLQDMRFDTACQSATGTVSSDVLTQNKARLQWMGPLLSGPVTCENGDVVMNLTGQDRQQSIEVAIRVSPAGTYRADINVLTRDERAGAVLPLFGFEASNDGYSLSESGSWK